MLMMMPMNSPVPQVEGASGLAEDLRISISRLSRRLRREGGGDLSVTQFAALAAVERHEAMTPRELADHEKVQPPSMTRVVAFLESQGLLVRAPHPTDGRQVTLRATEAGRALLAEHRALKQAWLSQMLAELPSQDLEVLEKAAPILRRLSQA